MQHLQKSSAIIFWNFKQDGRIWHREKKELVLIFVNPNAGKSTVRDDGYYEILKEGGLTNDVIKKWLNKIKKLHMKTKLKKIKK